MFFDPYPGALSFCDSGRAGRIRRKDQKPARPGPRPRLFHFPYGVIPINNKDFLQADFSVFEVSLWCLS